MIIRVFVVPSEWRVKFLEGSYMDIFEVLCWCHYLILDTRQVLKKEKALEPKKVLINSIIKGLK